MSDLVSSETTSKTESKTYTSVNFYDEKHVAYIKKVANDTESFEFVVSQHFRMSGVYWGLTALCALGVDIHQEMDLVNLIEWLLKCQDDTTGG